jgi:hypothetical protein
VLQALSNEYQVYFVVHSPSTNGATPETSSPLEILKSNLDAFESKLAEVFLAVLLYPIHSNLDIGSFKFNDGFP